jgi:hypothetical protein
MTPTLLLIMLLLMAVIAPASGACASAKSLKGGECQAFMSTCLKADRKS